MENSGSGGPASHLISTFQSQSIGLGGVGVCGISAMRTIDAKLVGAACGLLGETAMAAATSAATNGFVDEDTDSMNDVSWVLTGVSATGEENVDAGGDVVSTVNVSGGTGKSNGVFEVCWVGVTATSTASVSGATGKSKAGATVVVLGADSVCAASVSGAMGGGSSGDPGDVCPDPATLSDDKTRVCPKVPGLTPSGTDDWSALPVKLKTSGAPGCGVPLSYGGVETFVVHGDVSAQVVVVTTG